MGYSARYHAASLAAVFLALAVGILIGAGFGDELVEGGTEDLEQSLQSDLEEAQAQIDELEAELEREREFSAETYPALVDGALPGRRVAVVAFGSQSEELRTDIRDALEPSGATVTQVAVVQEPPDRAGLASAAGDPGAREIEREDGSFTDFARRLGRNLVTGGALYERAQEALLSGFSGEADSVSSVIVARERPDDLEGDELDETEMLETGLLEGMAGAGVPVVGVQRTDSNQSSAGYFESRGLSTVDNVDQTAGRVSLVYALGGAQGNFGVGENADALLPDLLAQPPGAPSGLIPSREDDSGG
jgi:Copper transport outer membrane protein, MctB